MKNIKKTHLIALTLFLIILGLIVFLYLKTLKLDDVELPPTNDGTTVIKEDDNFTLKTEYIGDNTWEYTVTGMLPTPCHGYILDTLVMESYPEQINVTIEIENTGEICAQVIQEVEESGTFTASSKAEISLKVNRISNF